MKYALGIFLAVIAPCLCEGAAEESTPRGVTWLVEYYVAQDGMPKDIRIIVTADPKLDSHVIAAVAKTWKSPPDQVGQRIRQHFQNVGQWSDGTVPGPNATYVEVAFSIGAVGVPEEIILKGPEDRTKPPSGTQGSRLVVGAKVTKSVDDAAVIRTVSKWRFPEDLKGTHWVQGFYFDPENTK